MLWAGPPGARVWMTAAAAAAVHLLAAWFNGGSLHPDEHYQILEFAQYRLGRLPASDLAWEFEAQMRPGIQPWLATQAVRLWDMAGVSSPFVVAFSLRLLSTFFALWMSVELCVRCLTSIGAPWLRVAAFWGSIFLWIAPTAHGRFSSENWGGALLVGGVCLMLDLAESWPTRRRKAFALALLTGLVWSLAFYCRFQIGASIAGAGLWLLAVRRLPVRVVGVIAVAFVAGCGLNAVVDHWLYGTWTFTPYNYVSLNLLQGKASTFGVSPWWMLAVYMVVALIPPYSIGILALWAVGGWYARRHVLVWLVVPFLVVHSVVAHKEPRFLIPIVYLIGPLTAVCLDALPARMSEAVWAWLRTRWGRAHVAAWCGVNVLILCVVVLMPANVSYPTERWLWEEGRRGALTVYAHGELPLATSEGPTNSFYRSPNVTLTPLISSDQITVALERGPVLVYYKGADVPASVADAGDCLPVVRSVPTWLVWLERTKWLVDVDQSTICRVEHRP